jgi:hypothetical protein
VVKRRGGRGQGPDFQPLFSLPLISKRGSSQAVEHVHARGASRREKGGHTVTKAQKPRYSSASFAGGVCNPETDRALIPCPSSRQQERQRDFVCGKVLRVGVCCCAVGQGYSKSCRHGVCVWHEGNWLNELHMFRFCAAAEG